MKTDSISRIAVLDDIWKVTHLSRQPLRLVAMVPPSDTSIRRSSQFFGGIHLMWVLIWALGPNASLQIQLPGFKFEGEVAPLH